MAENGIPACAYMGMRYAHVRAAGEVAGIVWPPRYADPSLDKTRRAPYLCEETMSPSPKPKKSLALSGVPPGNTALCTVGRSGNDLHYRGYDILDFADQAEFEEVAYLLIHGRLPTASQLAAYKARLQSLRGLPANLKAVLEWIPPSAH